MFQSRQVRKLSSIALLLVFFLPMLAPLLALGQDSEGNLPACCRRNGAHHCMMSMGERAQLANHDPRFQAPLEKCPYCPATAVSAHPDHGLMPDLGKAIFAEIVSHPAVSPQTESKRRISQSRSNQKRGPPAASLSL